MREHNKSTADCPTWGQSVLETAVYNNKGEPDVGGAGVYRLYARPKPGT